MRFLVLVINSKKEKKINMYITLYKCINVLAVPSSLIGQTTKTEKKYNIYFLMHWNVHRPHNKKR